MNKTIYALGFFDGVHTGHAALLSACCRLAKEHGCKAGVVTFGAHPLSQVTDNPPPLITGAEDREWMLRHWFSMEEVITLPFDKTMCHSPWQEFLSMLCSTYGAAGFVCGEDFRFGYKGQGNAKILSQVCQEYNLPFALVPDQMMDGIRISSTYIRRQMEEGDFHTALRFLGHPHIFTGTVAGCLPDGTALLHLPRGLVVPREGRYACRCRFKEETRPTTVQVCPDASIQVQMPDGNDSLAGREITLEFIRQLEKA